MTFIEACWEGKTAADEIDQWVERWHNGDGEGWSLSLAQFLGMTKEQYARWVTDPGCLQTIIEESGPHNTTDSVPLS